MSVWLHSHTGLRSHPDGPHLYPQVSVLVLFALAFLTCVVFLVVYKVYKYDRACPDGFVLKVRLRLPLRPQALSQRG